MTKARDFADIAGAVSGGKIASTDVNVSFENITDTGTEGTKVATGTTAQRGSTQGQLRFNTTTGVAEIYNTAFSGANTSKSDPVYYLQKEERIVSVYPIPSTTVASGFTIRVAYKPSRSATTVDDVLFEDYAEIIGYGAKYRLFLSPGKPYSSLDAATTHKGLYTEGLNVAIQRASRGHVRSDLSVQLRSA